MLRTNISIGKSICKALVAAVAWFALALQFSIILNDQGKLGLPKPMLIANYFSYFTILSNFLVAVSLTCNLLFPGTSAGRFFSEVRVRSAIAVYIFIVGLVYNLVLRQTWAPKGRQLLADNLLHVAVPLAYVLLWAIFTPRHKLAWRDLLPWLIFPALYLVYSLVRGGLVNWYPYPFIHAGQLGYGRVAINSLGVLAAILLFGTACIAFNRAGNPSNVKRS